MVNVRWFNPVTLRCLWARSRSSIASELEAFARPKHDRDDDDMMTILKTLRTPRRRTTMAMARRR